MSFLGDNIPTFRITLPDGAIRYVQVPDSEDAYAAVNKILDEERPRFMGTTVVQTAFIEMLNINKE